MSTQTFTARLLTEPEVRQAHTLMLDVFMQCEAAEYSAEGIESFKEYVEYSYMLTRIQQGTMLLWGGFAGDELQGVLAAAPSTHLSLLFVRPAYQQQGLAHTMFSQMRQYLTEHGGYSRITVNAAPSALEAYIKLGFTKTEEEYSLGGIRFTPMTYLPE